MEIKAIMSSGINFGIVKKYVRGKDIAYGDDKVIIVTNEDLLASDTIGFDWQKITGILTTKGTKNSHSAIVAKQHEIPAVVVSDISDLKDGEYIAIDTFSSKEGKIYYYPSEKEIRSLLNKIVILNIEKENLNKYRGDSTYTRDGHKVILASNIGTSEELPNVEQSTAEGIGVVRTEFSYEMYDMLEGRLPTEDELYSEYKKISDSLEGKPIIIRTLDAGADKPVKSLINAGILKQDETNPALGSRGIRPCLEHPEVFRTQIKAILRANAKNKNLQIMFPMITSIEEIKEGKKIVTETIRELEENKVDYAETEIGVMVETPAIAQITDRLSNYCSFISVGTNDLTQYTTAADRMNIAVENIATPYNPGMVRLLNQIIDGAHNGKEPILCGMCGEIAGDLQYIPILLGMGLDEFSMNSSNVLPARRLISNLDLQECKKLVNDILDKDTSSEIEKLAKQFYRENNLMILEQEKEERQEKLNKTLEEQKDLEDTYYNLVHQNLPQYLNEDGGNDERE